VRGGRTCFERVVEKLSSVHLDAMYYIVVRVVDGVARGEICFEGESEGGGGRVSWARMGTLFWVYLIRWYRRGRGELWVREPAGARVERVAEGWDWDK
jgi:hypothetical protein